ncbi:MAG: hypothetical protein A2X77_01870 [Gammaproteobacteria bacterium GWE2_42_36]|nr:MAG: hypothetical protein A2X77_01870 [Gammaproteobacteria bacterium GWE2_42_36]HCU05208.1 hypothetical protein [Coxiellaceae bacterium]
MLRKLFCFLVVVGAIALAVLGLVLPQTALKPVIMITNFFDIMIPILAVGALINYIWKSNGCCCHHTEK